MRVLCVADEFAWPPVNGYRIRLANVVRSLATLGPVDYLAVLNDDRPADEAAVPEEAGLERLRVVRSGTRRRSLRVLARGVAGLLPRRVVWPDWGEAREVVREWSATGYDIVWCGHADTFAGLGPDLPAPVIVDLDNLEGRLLRERRAARPQDRTRSAVRRRVADVFDRLDEWRWSCLERSISRSVAATVVCSEVDRARLASTGVSTGVEIVPNAYEPPEPPTPRAGRGGPFTVTFVGLYLYEPNRDAARTLAFDVLPLLRQAEPTARVRLVGRHDGMLGDLEGIPGVEVVGEVPAIGPELAVADVVAVPIRFGSGTRVKILEAFAHGVPVVSTRLGAEGLDVIDGQHVLIAEEAESFARACLRLRDDPDAAGRLVSEARGLWERRYRWGALRDAVVSAVGTATARSGAAAPGEGRVA